MSQERRVNVGTTLAVLAVLVDGVLWRDSTSMTDNFILKSEFLLYK